MTDVIALVAQSQSTPPAQPNAAPLMIGVVLFIGVFFYMSTRSQKREREKKAGMLNSLAKNDRVMTIGGIIGTVVAVKDNEVTLKVDEATNTRMTFIRRAIQQVIKTDDDLKKADAAQ